MKLKIILLLIVLPVLLYSQNSHEQDSINDLRHAYPHPYGTVLGGQVFLDADAPFGIFLQDHNYMNLRLVDNGTKQIKGGFRNQYETSMGERHLMNVDYYLGKDKYGRSIINKLVISGYFDLVVMFYIRYWYNALAFAEVKNKGVIESYFLTDKIQLSCDLKKQTATIVITKAAIK
jgi:ABC-type dipeptide/oligopeptide/nickel transport system permease subunit